MATLNGKAFTLGGAKGRLLVQITTERNHREAPGFSPEDIAELKTTLAAPEATAVVELTKTNWKLTDNTYPEDTRSRTNPRRTTVVLSDYQTATDTFLCRLILPILIGTGALTVRWIAPLINKTDTPHIQTSPSEKEASLRIATTSTFIVSWLGIVFLGGGDIFPGWRHLIPILPITILLLSEIMATAEKNQRIQKPEIWMIVTAIISLNFFFQWNNKENIRAKNEMYAWLGKITGEYLNQAWGNLPASQQPLVAVTPAGALPFYSKLPTLDMHGLNDKYLTRNRAKTFGHGVQAHELINIDYVLSRKPDVIIANVGDATPEFNMIQIPEFWHNYQLVRFPYNPESEKFYPNFFSHAWIRKEKIPALLKNNPQILLKEWEYWNK